MKSSGTKSSTTQLPEWYEKGLQQLLASSQNVAARPFQFYQGPVVANPSQQLQSAWTGANDWFQASQQQPGQYQGSPPLQGMMPSGGQGQGINVPLNQRLAQQFGYTGQFGQGGWDQFMASMSPEQRAQAQAMIAYDQQFGTQSPGVGIGGLLNGMGMGAAGMPGIMDVTYTGPGAGSSNQDLGADPYLNAILAQEFGYTGSFGEGGWDTYYQTLSAGEKKRAREIIGGNYSTVPGIGTGGDPAPEGYGGEDFGVDPFSGEPDTTAEPEGTF